MQEADQHSDLKLLLKWLTSDKRRLGFSATRSPASIYKRYINIHGGYLTVCSLYFYLNVSLASSSTNILLTAAEPLSVSECLPPGAVHRPSHTKLFKSSQRRARHNHSLLPGHETYSKQTNDSCLRNDFYSKVV